MSPQLVKLTNTLRTKKKMCQGSHPDQDQTCSANHSEEVVFRAVSPHGHVYWEIEPKNQHIVQESPVPQHLRHIPNPNGVFDATNGIGKYITKSVTLLRSQFSFVCFFENQESVTCFT